MKKFNIILFALLIASTACGRTDLWEKANTEDGSGSSSGGGTVPAITAVVSPQGSGSAWLSGQPGAINSEIRIVFSKSLDVTIGPTLGGDMATFSTWARAATNTADDTLIITPASSRTNITGARLSVNCTSIENDNITLNLTYNIARSVYYVSPGAAGSLTGTRTDPMNSLQTAVDTAAAAVRPGVVLVSAGTFTADATLVTMSEGVSLYGGYSAANWDVRNLDVHITRLEDTRTSTGTNNLNTPIRLVAFGSGITLSTVFDGFTLIVAPVTDEMASAEPKSAAAIFVQYSSPVISNNTITSANITGGRFTATVGICLVGTGTPEIHHNTIALGSRSGTDSNSHYGIYGYNGPAPDIHDNYIKAGESTGNLGRTYGLYMHNCQGSISSNTLIDGGKASEAAAAVFLGGSGTEVIGNSLITSSTTGVTGKSAYGITVNGSTSIIEKNILANFNAKVVCCISVPYLSLPQIRSNYIDGGNCATVIGIQVNNEYTSGTEYTDIFNNVINAGTGTTTTGIEIYSINTRVRIINNTINGGGGTGNGPTGISLRRAYDPSKPILTSTDINITNNNIFTNTDGNTNMPYINSCGIREFQTTGSEPYTNTLAHNNIFNCAVLYYDFISGGTSISYDKITDLNLFAPDDITQASGNITDNIYSSLDSSNEYRFNGSLSSFTFHIAGIYGESLWGFANDREGIPRTSPWSIGAYEYD